MRKILLGILGGVALGALLISLVIFIGSLQSVGSHGNQTGTSQNGSSGIGGSGSTSSEDEESSDSEEPSETETGDVTDTESQLPTEPEWPSDLPTEPEPTTEPEQPTEEPTEDEPTEPEKPAKPKEIPYYIKVNRAANCVTIYTKDEFGNYTVPYKSMICSVGTYYFDTKTQTIKGNTPLGTYKMPGQRYKWRLLFGPDGLDVYGHYTTRIVGHILFHSVPYVDRGLTSGSEKTLWAGQYNMLGSPASKGCIRLSVEDAKWIYDNCGEGTTVEIYDDAENPGPLGRPDAIRIPDESPFAGWDPTDPDSKNPWHTGNVVLNGVTDVPAIERGTVIDWMQYFVTKTEDVLDDVTATDVDGLLLQIRLDSLLDIKKVGKYDMLYMAIGTTGKTDSKTIKVDVVDTIKPILMFKESVESGSVITVYDGDSKEIILEKIREMLYAADVYYLSAERNEADRREETLPASQIVVDLKNLEDGMKDKNPKSYTCTAHAVDLAGNKSETLTFEVAYERKDIAAPSITVTGGITTTVDLTGITEEADRLAQIIQGAENALVFGDNYSVSDDMSATDKITHTLKGSYTGATTAGTAEVTVTITAKDEAGKETKTTVVVTVSIRDDSTEESTETGSESNLQEDPESGLSDEPTQVEEN